MTMEEIILGKEEIHKGEKGQEKEKQWLPWTVPKSGLLVLVANTIPHCFSQPESVIDISTKAFCKI